MKTLLASIKMRKLSSINYECTFLMRNSPPLKRRMEFTRNDNRSKDPFGLDTILDGTVLLSLCLLPTHDFDSWQKLRKVEEDLLGMES